MCVFSAFLHFQTLLANKMTVNGVLVSTATTQLNTAMNLEL